MEEFFESFKVNVWPKIRDFLTSTGINVLIGILLLIVGLFIIKKLAKFICNRKGVKKLTPNVQTLVKDVIQVVLYVILFVTIAAIVGIPTASIIATISSCGLAIGLALQGALGNLAGGLLILITKPFQINDFIETGDLSGTVIDIGVCYTKLLTVQNQVITIPNAGISNQVVKNYSINNTRRLDLVFSASYSDDVNKVKSIIESVVSSHELVLKDPAPFIKLSSHNASSLDYTVRVWTKSSDYWTVNFDLIESVKKAFDENGIEIPFQQIDIHVNNIESK